MQVPGLYKPYEIELAFLKLLKWPDPDTLLNKVPEPKEQNAINEGLAVVLGQPIAVYPEQDHLAHLQVHLDFVKSPVLGGSPLFTSFLPPLLKHCTEHVAYYYAKHTELTVTLAAGVSHEMLAGDDPEVKASFDKLLAQASQTVVPELQEALAQAMPVLLQAMQQVKASMPPPPMDPSAAALQVAQAETQRKAAADQAGHQVDVAKLQQDGQQGAAKIQSDGQEAAGKQALEQQQVALEAQRVQQEADASQLESSTKIATTNIDADTARDISADRLASGAGGVGYKNGESISKP